MTPADADRAARRAALVLAFALPGDATIYLLLPLYAATFGVSLAEAGVLLAANRLIRIAGYGAVARLYASGGPRTACVAAGIGAALSTLGYFLFSGVWLLLAARLVWGLSFAALNIANQALPIAAMEGAARRAGRARAIVAVGPMVGLMGGAFVAEAFGPRVVFLILGVAAIAAPLIALGLPRTPEAFRPSGPRFGWPSALNLWSFAQGLTLDGIFVFGISLLAAKNLPQGAVIAAGAALALRYAVEIGFSPMGGTLAQRHGARRMVIALSLGAAGGLALLGANGAILWLGVLVTIVLRALMQPLPGPLVAETFPRQDERVAALASQATWRDIGAGAGPLIAGIVLPLAAPALIYGAAAGLLAGTSAWLAHATSRDAKPPT